MSKPTAAKKTAKAPQKTGGPVKAATPAKKTATKAAAATPSSTRKRAAASASPKPKLMTAKTPAAKSKSAATGAASKAVSKAAPKKPAAKKATAAPKGPLTEAQIRKMSDNDYMNEAQLTFFRERLLMMRAEVLAREVDVKERLHQREIFADPADRATAEEEHWLDLRLRERESLLLRKIDEALKRIVDREYGYCEKTGDPIGIPRLLARPTATVCVDIKGQDERVEAQYRDR
ncbi:RNA polymerase-binding protein DksA [Flagellatimonas centrodinii]|uniref:RNA polymerase-binding protein DksA n=1 Tax=Flagellatimonas centrodinii TaxID=2806210 RepID=UPI001EFA626A|nr:RNA polymerase-binding protein DksA [Flagellatimonas centrodinii]ULQ46326.1 RNA polymerase-binding protein DksA [Flagellatimonas centrodinii]